MTFSVLGADGSGVGIAVTSSSVAVAARCTHLRAGVGGAVSQNITDPRLGTALLDALQSGSPPDEALLAVVSAQPDIEYRQLTVLDHRGDSAAFSGQHVLGVANRRSGRFVVAAGNLLATPTVIDAVIDKFEEVRGQLECRLMAALEAGLAVGGEEGPLRSAGLSVVRECPWRETDLRVDWHDEPVSELRRLLDLWLPQRDDYVTRALSPGEAPSYGVPGDE